MRLYLFFLLDQFGVCKRPGEVTIILAALVQKIADRSVFRRFEKLSIKTMSKIYESLIYYN